MSAAMSADVTVTDVKSGEMNNHIEGSAHNTARETKLSAQSNEEVPDEHDLIDTWGAGHFTSEYNKLRDFRKREVHWNYYDAMHMSKPTAAAREAGTNSLEEGNLDKYFKQTLSRSKFNNLDTFLAASQSTNPFAHYTPPFDQLLPLQQEDGRWLDLPKVLRILQLPKDTRLEKATTWEMASAFVLALIRQRVEIFGELQPFHDKGVANFPTSELITQAKELILINDLTLELKAVMKSRGVVYEEDEIDEREQGDDEKEGEHGVDLTMEMVANEKWHTKVGGLLDHANDEFSEDPFMQFPDQDTYAEMTARVTKDTGALPIPAMTTMSSLHSDDVLVHWDERPASRGKRKKDKEGHEEQTDINKDKDKDKDKSKSKSKSKSKENSNPVEEVDEDYQLASDEEWATDSDEDDFEEGHGEEKTQGGVAVTYGPVEEVDEDYQLASDEEWVTDSDEEEEEGQAKEEKGETMSQPRGLSLASLGIQRPGTATSSAPSSKPGSPEHRPAHRVSTPSKSALRPSSQGQGQGQGQGRGPDTADSRPGTDRDRDRDMGVDLEEGSVRSNRSRGLSVTFSEKEGPGQYSASMAEDGSLDTGSGGDVDHTGSGSIVLDGNEGSWDVEATQLQGHGQELGGKSALALSVPDEPSAENGGASPPAATATATATGDEDLLDRIRSLTPQKDAGKIRRKQQELDDCTIQAVGACEEIERQVELIKDCLARSIVDYNAALTQEERNVVFDELTSMLGDDAPPREGFLDWRKDGLPGMRPRCVKFFNLVYRMGKLRLDLEELQTPGGRDPSKPQPPPLDRDWDWYDGKEEDNEDIWRWGFVWNGVDMVTKVLHCLDFLRMQKELAAWYGRSFWFTGNVLMLPFQPYTAYPKLGMNDKLKEVLMTKPHVRPACTVGGEGFTLVGVAPGSPTWEKCGGDIASLNAAQAWKHEKYMLRWRERFEELCNGVRYSNWPNVPSLKRDQDNEEMYNCMVVLYVRCKKTLLSTYRWEKEFISLTSTVRGQGIMMGESGLKPDRSLDRQVEQRLIKLKEEAEEARLRRVEEEALNKKKQDKASVAFLSTLMRQTKVPVVKRMNRDELLAQMKLEERRKIFQRLITPKKRYGEEDYPDLERHLPFEGWSSVDLHRPGSPDKGFGSSPTRSPPPYPYWYDNDEGGVGPQEGWTLTSFGNIVGPEGLVRADEFGRYVPKGITLSPLRPRQLVVGEWDGDGRRVRNETIDEMVGGKKERDSDDESGSEDEEGGGDGDDDDDGAPRKKTKKKRKRKRKGKGLTGASTRVSSNLPTQSQLPMPNVPTRERDKKLTRQGSRILRQILGDEHKGPVSRHVVHAIADKDNKVSRLAAGPTVQTLTRRAAGVNLPPVRRGGGAIYQPSPVIAKRIPRNKNV